MKKILFSAIALAVSLAGYAQWKPAGDKIKPRGQSKSIRIMYFRNIPDRSWNGRNGKT